jgi:energy-coupling factor transporter ATP-binding protein EcfA2
MTRTSGSTLRLTKAAGHVWDTLVRYDPAHAAEYQANGAPPGALDTLHTCAANRRHDPCARRVLVTAHDAFGYFGRAYDIEVIGLQGISTVAEYGLQDLTRLVDLIAARQIPAVFVESSVPKKSTRRCRAPGNEAHRPHRRSALLRRDGRGRHSGRDLRRHGSPQRADDRGGVAVRPSTNPMQADSPAATPAGGAPPPPIEVHNLTVAYGRRPVLWDVDFAVPEGQLIALVGPNGAGKSTLIKAIMGLMPLSSGWVKIHGRPLQEQRGLVAAATRIGDWDFYRRARRVDGAVLPPAALRRPGCEDRRVAPRAWKVGMGDYADRQISQLSGGQQQRVFLARALAQQTRVYLMDEPLAGVDATTERPSRPAPHEGGGQDGACRSPRSADRAGLLD